MAWLRSRPVLEERSTWAWETGPLMRIRTTCSRLVESTTMASASRFSSGVSPRSMDLVSTKVMWLTLGTRVKSPRTPKMWKRPSVGRTSPAMQGLGQRAVDPQIEDHVQLGREVVLHHEAVAHGAHPQIEGQVFQQGHPVVEGSHRRLVDVGRDHQLAHGEVLQVAARGHQHLAVEGQPLVRVARQLEVETDVVQLHAAGGEEREAPAAERDPHGAQLGTGEQPADADPSGCRRVAADAEAAVAIDPGLQALQGEAVAAELDHPGLDHHVSAQLAQPEIRGS